MTEYGQILDQLTDQHSSQEKQIIDENKTVLENTQSSDALFTVDQFVANLSKATADKNKAYATRPIQNISGYDVASGCVRQIYYRLMGIPLRSYEDLWLPVTMRGVIGSAVHDYIQEHFEFTEVEKSMKIPSINFSGRYDCSIGNHTLVEIKTAPYLGEKGYENIIKTQQARIEDFYQVMTYKYVLETFLDEMKRQPLQSLRTEPPAADEYNIKHLQFIYVAHDIISADLESVQDNKTAVAALKRELKSSKNKFSFITCITYDLTRIPNVDDYTNYIKNKIEMINDHLSSNKTPMMDNPFINKKSCYFCKYKDQCRIEGG
jgi:hypothetical protein